MVIVLLTGLGICFGSFINALVWRLHEQSMPKKKRVATDSELSISRGRSMCPHCQHTLGALDLLPVASWLALKGRCRYCQHPISWQYPVVELLLPLSFIASYLFWPSELAGRGLVMFVTWLLALILLLALAVYDLRWMLLPNKLVFPLIGIGLTQVAISSILFGTSWQQLSEVCLAIVVAGGIYYALFQFSKGAWIGGGDVKLGYAIGLFVMTPEKAFLVLFVASLIGLVIVFPGVVSRKLQATSRIPFGPSLIIATFVVMLFGQRMIDWYTAVFL